MRHLHRPPWPAPQRSRRAPTATVGAGFERSLDFLEGATVVGSASGGRHLGGLRRMAVRSMSLSNRKSGHSLCKGVYAFCLCLNRRCLFLVAAFAFRCSSRLANSA